MAAKAKEKVTDVTEVTEVNQNAEDLSQLLESEKAEKDALLAELEELRKAKAEAEAEAKRLEKEAEEFTYYTSQLIPGEALEEEVIINGKITKFRRGHRVKLPRAVASILIRRDLAKLEEFQNQQRMKKQFTDEYVNQYNEFKDL